MAQGAQGSVGQRWWWGAGGGGMTSLLSLSATWAAAASASFCQEPKAKILEALDLVVPASDPVVVDHHRRHLLVRTILVLLAGPPDGGCVDKNASKPTALSLEYKPTVLIKNRRREPGVTLS